MNLELPATGEKAVDMTVTELIEQLQKMPQDASVKYIADEPVEVTEVRVYTEPRSWGGAQWVRLD